MLFIQFSKEALTEDSHKIQTSKSSYISESVVIMCVINTPSIGGEGILNDEQEIKYTNLNPLECIKNEYI